MVRLCPQLRVAIKDIGCIGMPYLLEIIHILIYVNHEMVYSSESNFMKLDIFEGIWKVCYLQTEDANVRASLLLF